MLLYQVHLFWWFFCLLDAAILLILVNQSCISGKRHKNYSIIYHTHSLHYWCQHLFALRLFNNHGSNLVTYQIHCLHHGLLALLIINSINQSMLNNNRHISALLKLECIFMVLFSKAYYETNKILCIQHFWFTLLAIVFLLFYNII